MKTYQLQVCPGCGAEQSSEFLLGPEHRLRACAACALVYAPAYAEPTEIYSDGYLLEDSEFGNNFGFEVLNPVFQEFVSHVATRRFEVIEKVARPPGQFLDVGCGTGEVLMVARDRGWTVHGAEPVEDSARYASEERGLDVRPCLLEDSDLPQHSYDVVSAFHVLEHMTDGLGFLRSIARWARPGGHLVVEVPNWRSMHRRGNGAAWPSLRPLEHVAHYTPATLAATLRRAGLEPVRVDTPGFLWPKETLNQMLADLGISRLERWIMRTRLFDRPGEQEGVPVTRPTRAGWLTLNALERSYALTRTGMVVLAIARVP